MGARDGAPQARPGRTAFDQRSGIEKSGTRASSPPSPGLRHGAGGAARARALHGCDRRLIEVSLTGGTRRVVSPARILAASLAGLVLAGTALLSLPIAATTGALAPIDALFTAISAVCVTGLIVVDTAADLSTFGQLVRSN
jgi:hypothetical protein